MFIIDAERIKEEVMNLRVNMETAGICKEGGWK